MTIITKRGIVMASDKRIAPKEVREIMRRIPRSMGNTGWINLGKTGKGTKIVTIVREKAALKALEDAR